MKPNEKKSAGISKKGGSDGCGQQTTEKGRGQSGNCSISGAR